MAVTCTPALREAARDVLASSCPACSEKQRAQLEPLADGSAALASTAALRVLRGRLGDAAMFQALRGCEARGAAPAAPEWRERLQARAKERAYQRSIALMAAAGTHGSTDLTGGSSGTQSMHSVMKQASIGVNMIAAIATAGVVGHYAGAMISPAGPHRWVGALICIVSMVLIEAVLFMVRESMQEKIEKRRGTCRAGGARPDLHAPGAPPGKAESAPDGVDDGRKQHNLSAGGAGAGAARRERREETESKKSR